ncbi:MAG: hypothetical protein LUG98_11985 [Tannerellaceae bacterium]|nr:hypothetical protein [Tannerellaceae bacterium]
MNKKAELVYWLILFSFLSGITRAENYYVHASTGNDSNPGTSTEVTWQSLQNINNHTFQPGDTLFMARGSRWSGTIKPKGSGAPGLPVVITAYGEGNKPLIDLKYEQYIDKKAGEATILFF